MRKISLLIFLLFPSFIFAQEQQKQSLNIGNASVFLDTKIMEDGTIIDVGFGLSYSDIWGGEIRGRGTKSLKNEEISDPDIADSLIVINETIFEMSLLPIQYRYANKKSLKFWFGAGLYYEYQKSSEKGFIDMPILESVGQERVNSVKDDFSLHLTGPLLDIMFSYYSEWFNIGFSGGIVPVFFLTAKEKYSMFPLIPKSVEHSQKTFGSPYFYLGLNSVLFKYVNLSFLYNYAQLKYQIIDFDDNLSPIHPETTVVTQSLMFQISALLPLGGFGFQIGYGYMMDFYTHDFNNSVSEDKHYLILSGKKLLF